MPKSAMLRYGESSLVKSEHSGRAFLHSAAIDRLFLTGGKGGDQPPHSRRWENPLSLAGGACERGFPQGNLNSLSKCGPRPAVSTTTLSYAVRASSILESRRPPAL